MKTYQTHLQDLLNLNTVYIVFILIINFEVILIWFGPVFPFFIFRMHKEIEKYKKDNTILRIKTDEKEDSIRELQKKLDQ